MRRRLTLTIVAVVAGALVVAGLGTLVLVRISSRQSVRSELVREAEAIAAAVDESGKPRNAVLLQRVLRLEGFGFVAIGPRGAILGTPPDGLTVADLHPDALVANRTVSGTRGSLAYAAAPTKVNRGVAAVVITRRVDAGTAGISYFLLAAGLALVVAVLVAQALGRRITQPLEEAETVTRRIASGDLEARVVIAGDADPELSSLAASINTMADNLNRAKGLERQFLMSVSHDLRTPLTSIRGFAEAIADGAAPDATRAAEVIAAESRRLERLVGDLLQLAQLDARRFTLDLRDIDVAEVVADTAEGFQPAAGDLGVELAVRTPPRETLRVRADPDRLAQIVANLVENAMKYAVSSIVVTASADPEGPVVTVSDDGPGISPADAPHVFERLYVGARTPTRRLGSGLGLAIVSELVAALGGTVIADNTEGGGARFTVRLRPSSSSSS
ncbi:MAG: two-component system, OmpR family, sensor kinase [Actinomycetota bacterium]|nr:two-component system, OmpR family, sensor kinase [Actinomycetota bacterium]